MKFVMAIFEDPKDLASREPEGPYFGAWKAYHQALVATGAHEGGAPLMDPATATLVRVRDGRRQVQDGPFADAKEQLGGFMVLELPSLDAALDWAARCPAAARGAVEIRPMAVEFRDAVCKV
jgi:hypothetical protein